MRIILVVFGFVIISCSNRTASLDQLEQLRNIFGTANWQVMKGADTSYIFFSPQNDNSFKAYQFRLFRGDSIDTKTAAIKANEGKVEWKFFDKTLILTDVDSNQSSWRDTVKMNYVLTKQNDSVMQMKTSDGNVQFKRTLPLSTFLVRAKYDYEHGSKLLDSNEVRPRKLIRY